MEKNNLELRNSNSRELESMVYESITLNGIEYKPKFSSQGIDIPIVMTTYSSYNDRIMGYKVIYQRIPRDIIIGMIRECLPEILRGDNNG